MNRDIFSYFNGEKTLFADPLRLRRELTKAFGPTPERMWEDLKSPDEGIRGVAEDRFLDAVAGAFHMVPFDSATSQGALDQDVFAAYDKFILFLDTLKKKEQSGRI